MSTEQDPEATEYTYKDKLVLPVDAKYLSNGTIGDHLYVYIT